MGEGREEEMGEMEGQEGGQACAPSVLGRSPKNMHLSRPKLLLIGRIGEISLSEKFHAEK